MNHRPRTAVSTMLVVCAAALLVGAPAPSSAQQASMPSGARSAADATSFKPAIDQFVKQQVDRLNDTKTPGNIHQARVLIEAQIGGNPTPSFLQVYAASINTNIQPLANAKDLVTRLNAAIIVAHVAERAKNAELAPAAAKFMNDPHDAVALWGVKAAKQIIPVILNAGGVAQDPLTPNLLNVVKKNWFSGAIAYEAYDALRLNTADPPGPGVPVPPGQFPPAAPAAIKSAANAMLGLLAFRAEMYGKGVPPTPSAETVSFNFLGQRKVWQQLTPAQQVQLMQLQVNLVSFGGQHAAVLEPDPRAAIAAMLAAEGSAIQVIGQVAADPATENAGKPLRSFGVSTPGDVIFNTTTASVTALVTTSKWKAQLKAPAAIGDAAGKILSPSEPLEDEATPAATAGGASGGAGTSTGTPAKGPGAATGGTGAGGSGGTGAGPATGGAAGSGAPQ